MADRINTNDHYETVGTFTGTSLVVTPGDTSLQATTVTTLTASGTAIFNGASPFSTQVSTSDTTAYSGTWDRALIFVENTDTTVPTSACGIRLKTTGNGTSYLSLLSVASAANSADLVMISVNAGTKAEKLRVTAAGALSVLTTVTGTQLISSVATGTAPLSVASTTVVPNLNSSTLLGSTWASPAALGSTVAANVTAAVLQSNSSALFNNASVFDYTLNGAFAAITTRNSHTGVSAVSQFNIGNNASDSSFHIDVNGGNFSSVPNQVALVQSANASILIKTNNTTAMTINGSQQINVVGPLINASYNLNQVLLTAQASTPLNMTAAQTNTYFTNAGASALIVFNLPTAAAGLIFTFITIDSDGVKIVAAAGDNIQLFANVSATAGFIKSVTVGSTITLVAVDATTWKDVSEALGSIWTVDV